VSYAAGIKKEKGFLIRNFFAGRKIIILLELRMGF